MMRLILTTIILTMLAQPVWAADFPHYCDELSSEATKSMKDHFEYSDAIQKFVEEHLEEPKNNFTERLKTFRNNERFLENAGSMAAIYLAFCKS